MSGVRQTDQVQRSNSCAEWAEKLPSLSLCRSDRFTWEEINKHRLHLKVNHLYRTRQQSMHLI